MKRLWKAAQSIGSKCFLSTASLRVKSVLFYNGVGIKEAKTANKAPQYKSTEHEHIYDHSSVEYSL